MNSFANTNSTNQKKPLGCLMQGCLAIALHSIWVGLLLAGLYYAFNSFRLVTGGVEVDAVVIDTGIYNDSEGGTTYSPIFEYTYEGQTYQYDSVNSSGIFTHKLGDHVTLIVDPNNPKNARQNIFSELWMLPSILTPISLCVGVLMIFVNVFLTRFGKLSRLGSFELNQTNANNS